MVWRYSKTPQELNISEQKKYFPILLSITMIDSLYLISFQSAFGNINKRKQTQIFVKITMLYAIFFKKYI